LQVLEFFLGFSKARHGVDHMVSFLALAAW